MSSSSKKSAPKAKKTIKKLIRPLEGRKVAGVAVGLANYFEVDVTLIRVLMVLTFIPGGAPGLFIYLLCWLLIPTEE